ncbi:MAG: hypothetical protein VB115_09750 [Christensenellaceae bacterium]|nr:hypothetical protein [Christensenellaceae bacterium]
MEMGKLTAKLRDAVPVCLLVDGKEIKRYKNIEIPDALKVLEYQDFKFDVPLSGAITFKIMFEPGVLPEVFPQARERRTRKPLPQEAQPQEAAPAEIMVAEAEPQQEPVKQDDLPPEGLPASVMEAFAQALEDAQAAGEPVAEIAEAMADGEIIKAEIIEDTGAGQLIVITAEQEAMPEPVETIAEATETPVEPEAEVQPEDNVPAKKPTRKGKGKKDTVATDSANK